jgi:hypothetical protein
MTKSTYCLITVLLIFVAGFGAIRPAKVECIAGCGEGPNPGPAALAKLIEPFGIAFDKEGNGYICEYKGQRLSKVTRDGFITPFAGTGTQGYGGDGAPAREAVFNDPHGLVIGKDQRLYVADTINHRIRQIDLKTGQISTIAGTGESGFSGDGADAKKARFNGVYGIDINRSADRIYVADLVNRRIRMVNLKTHIVSTIAGNGQSGIPADGADAAQSPLVDPRAVAVDSKGNVYVLERRGNALRVVDKEGKIRTLISPAAQKTPPRSGTIERDLNGPKHLCVDHQDSVIIADAENHLIRRYRPKDGRTVIIAGTGEKGALLVGNDPLKTQLNRPHGVFVDRSGVLYVTDSYNHRVLKITGW